MTRGYNVLNQSEAQEGKKSTHSRVIGDLAGQILINVSWKSRKTTWNLFCNDSKHDSNLLFWCQRTNWHFVRPEDICDLFKDILNAAAGRLEISRSLFFLCPTKLHLCPQKCTHCHFFTLCPDGPDPPILCPEAPDPPNLCPALHVRRASRSSVTSVDLGQLIHTGSDGRR